MQYSEALDDGDLLAAALSERDDLAEQLRAMRFESEEERQQADREIGDLQQRQAALEREGIWTANELDAVRARLRAAEEEREQLRVETQRLRKDLATVRAIAEAVIGTDVSERAVDGSAGRAERRRTERDARRRRR